ncbi:hypothetical protein Tco_0625888 [Tanacetum coccineum]|uniref:Uncharacterized protein n=1 Tax=Tanacetum coccineum TaxID=301880 RepID=A0ABQ4WI38_9ASTR
MEMRRTTLWWKVLCTKHNKWLQSTMSNRNRLASPEQNALGQEAPSVTQHQPSSSVVPPTPPTTQPIPSEAITISPLSQPAPPTPIAETTTTSPLPSPSPAHEPMEHTFEQPY